MLQHPREADQGAAKVDCGAFEELWINNPWKLGYLLRCGCTELCREAWEYRVDCVEVIRIWLR